LLVGEVAFFPAYQVREDIPRNGGAIDNSSNLFSAGCQYQNNHTVNIFPTTMHSLFESSVNIMFQCTIIFKPVTAEFLVKITSV
jgi:hypothetical protein